MPNFPHPERGEDIMQFILELLWDLSRDEYLENLPHEEERS